MSLAKKSCISLAAALVTLLIAVPAFATAPVQPTPQPSLPANPVQMSDVCYHVGFWTVCASDVVDAVVTVVEKHL